MNLDKFPGKPSGLSLRRHTDNVKAQGGQIRSTWPYLMTKFSAFFDLRLDELCVEAEEYHDYGKACKIWREACEKDVARYRRWLEQKGLEWNPEDWRTHEAFEEACRKANQATAPHLLKAGLRHEFASIRWIEKNRPDFDWAIKAAIAAHHGKLSHGEYARKRWWEDERGTDMEGPYAEYYRAFQRHSNQVKEGSFAEAVLARYRYAAVRSLLQIADTRASRKEGMGEEGMVPLQTFAPPRPFPSLRPVQRLAQAAGGRMRTILRAPTGSGKTYACLLWAQEHILAAQPRADRLVIAMPTRFTSNALRKSVQRQIPEFVHPITGKKQRSVGLYHSSAFYNLFGEEGDRSWGSIQVEEQKLAKQLAYPVTVCTIDHLLACLVGANERHYETFFFLANSCVVFDETDFYDEFVQANMRQLLEVLEILKVPTLIMSATVADVAKEMYGVDEIVNVEQPGSERIEKRVHYLGEAEGIDEAIADVLEEMIRRRKGIIYANTVSRALAYYGYLSARVNEDLPLILYHSRFTEPDKKAIEEKLERALGDRDDAAGIAIMTQIGEMSVNISAEIMLTDVCPWDRLAQRMGRLARFSLHDDKKVEADIYVINPLKESAWFAWPYVQLKENSKTEYVPNAAFLGTVTRINELTQDGKYVVMTPEDLVRETNLLYDKATEFSPATQANQRVYRRLIRDNWLLSGLLEMTDDESQVTDSSDEWQSRNIPGQNMILMEEPASRYYSWQRYQDFVLRCGVSCPKYKITADQRLAAKGEKHCLEKVLIIIGQPGSKREKPIEVYKAVRGAYRKEIGLAALYGYDWQRDPVL